MYPKMFVYRSIIEKYFKKEKEITFKNMQTQIHTEVRTVIVV